MDARLDRLAAAYGIAGSYTAEGGEPRTVDDAVKRRLLRIMGVDPGQGRPPRAAPQEAAGATGAVPRCHVPSALRRGRVWGVTCQLYGLVSARNWGIGDFDDLARLAEAVAAQGGDFVGVSPLHALFPAEPERCSPYSPSDRRFLNVLHIAPDAEPEYDAAAIPDAALAKLRRGELVDYAAVAAAKMAALQRMFAAFQAAAEPRRRADFEAWRRERGETLERHGIFDAMSIHIAATKGAPLPWPRWPEEWRRPDGGGVRRWAAENADAVSFHVWLQWLAERQLAAAQARARAAGMRVGLYLDLAVGTAPDGALAWSDPELMVTGAHIGSPPDAYNAAGQDWGLVPQRPDVIVARDCAPLAEDLAASMRHAGAVRLDHVMALRRLFWVPAGAEAREGGYVRYPFAALRTQVAASSRRHDCLVIGEALGTVPEGFVGQLTEAEIHTYKVLLFEKRADGSFRHPRSIGRRALACLSTHDLATLAGWWRCRDTDWREQLGLLDAAQAAAQRRARGEERAQLLRALRRVGLRPEQAADAPDLAPETLVAAHRYMARSPARLMAVQLEDALGMVEQANLPGRTEPHPNWRRRLPVPLEALPQHPLFAALAQAMREERPRQAGAARPRPQRRGGA